MAKNIAEDGYIEIVGARENNLKNVSVKIPRNQLVVITGISGSGKSSLAFDTLYAEGQRRYMETFSSYARQFLGNMERPDVEKIEGLSPVISIEQKTTAWNPRSTVGTTTEIYDFLRLLFARGSDAYSYVTGKKMVKYTENQIIGDIFANYKGKKIVILAPMVRSRKGHYRELFENVRKKGYTKVRVDGEVIDLKQGLQVDRYKVHDIELIVDRLTVEEDKKERISNSLETALKMGEDFIYINEHGTFNSPYGTCPACKGLGKLHKADMDKVIPDDTKSIKEVGIKPFGEVRENTTFKQIKKIAKKYKFDLNTPIKDIPKEALEIMLYGGDSSVGIDLGYSPHEMVYNLATDGIVNMLERWYKDTTSEKIRNWAEEFLSIQDCSECEGYRLKKSSLFFRLGGMHIGQLATMDLDKLYDWFENVDDKLSARQKAISKDVVKEIKLRLGFLLEVGLNYLSLNRPTRTLSGGESQRTRLATQIGSQLTGITYVMDEPSIGLHQRDNQRLINALKNLTEIGNTVVVVEHDKDIMLASDYLIDIGPGAGKNGGEIVAEGHPKTFKKIKTITANYLSDRARIEVPEKRRKGTGKKLTLKGATGNDHCHMKK